MSKFLMALVICSGLFVTANAQSKFSIGPNAGVGASWISGLKESAGVSDTKNKMAGNVGISTVYSAAEHFGIGADVKYSFEGAKFNVAGTMADLNLNYVRIPVKAIVFFNGYGDRVRPKIFAGPSFGFLTSAKTKYESTNMDVKSSFNGFDLGVTAGAGLNFRMVSNTWLNLDLNYLHGISNINKDDTDPKAHNRNLSLNVGVNFGI